MLTVHMYTCLIHLTSILNIGMCALYRETVLQIGMCDRFCYDNVHVEFIFTQT
jgi:hypothetical protein